MSTTKKRKSVEYGRWGYFFIAPFFIVYLIFQLWPLIYTFILSTQQTNTRFSGNSGMTFCGLDNFTYVLGITSSGSSMFFSSLGSTLIMWICNFIPQILLSLLLAVWLTDTKCKLKGQGAFKIMVYLPNIITAASISYLFASLFGNLGSITIALRSIGIISEKFSFMDSVWGTRGIISFIQFWMWYGNTTLLLISGVLGINPSLFEAADIDGCTGSQKFFHVTLPCLRPIMLYVLVTSVIGGLQMYDIPALFNVTEKGIGKPDFASQTVTMYINQLRNTETGRAAAMSVLLFIITLIVSLLFFYFMGDHEKKPKKQKS